LRGEGGAMAKAKEKRIFNRLDAENQNSAIVSISNYSEEARLLDVSAGGMRINFSKPVKKGSYITGKFNILSSIRPFFGEGQVTRVEKKKKNWELAVKFKRVSTIPFSA